MLKFPAILEKDKKDRFSCNLSSFSANLLVWPKIIGKGVFEKDFYFLEKGNIG
jgi:hypothetical protein